MFGALDWKAPEKKKKTIIREAASQKKPDKVMKV